MNGKQAARGSAKVDLESLSLRDFLKTLLSSLTSHTK